MTMLKSAVALLAFLAPTLILAAKPDPEVLNAIRDQGFNHSQVMPTLQHLTDQIGPRLTNSPNMREASRWTREQLQDWGLANAHLENYEFGRGWSYDRVSVDLLAPRKTSLHAIPVAWTPGTAGPVEADVVYLDAVTAEELQKYRGKLKGKAVMLSEPVASEEAKREITKRYSAAELADMRSFNINARASDADPLADTVAQRHKTLAFNEARETFLRSEGAKAALIKSPWDGGLIISSGQNFRVGKTFPIPMLTLSAEHYDLLARLLESGITPKIAFDVKARFHDEDTNGQNTIAEIPGSGDKPEIVMLGAHLDSWHGATGGVDNGAGVAITMEAIRILKAINLQPKRTIRIGLWGGEEEGLFGSLAYVEQHFASRPGPSDPKERELSRYSMWTTAGWPITKKPEHDLLSVYFNIDNGAGRLRGIGTQGNVGAKAVFAEWFSAVADLSDGTISTNNKYSTDHESFDHVGLPGFQFIQDPLDYGTRLHHSDVDTYDHALPDDMKQAAVVLATIVYQAAQADARMPRKPMPAALTAAEAEAEKRQADKRVRAKERKALSDLAR